MPKYTDAENKQIVEAKADEDRNAGNRKLVKIVAKKDKIPDEALISLDLADEDRRMVQKTDDGFYNLCNERHTKSHQEHLERYRCVDRDSTKCNLAFKCLQVNGKAYGFFVGQHNHLPHVNFELVETFRLLATVDEEGDQAELSDFNECHKRVKGKMGVPGQVDDKFMLYIAITAGIDKETFLRMPVAERFRHADYVGQTKQQIVDRLMDHSKPHRFLFDFTAGGEVPTFLVVHSKHELSAGEAVYSEHKLIALAESDHPVHNSDRPGKWSEIEGVSRVDQYRHASVTMRELLMAGEIHECDWAAKLEKHKAKKPKTTLTINTSATSTTSEEKTPAVGRRTKKRARSDANTPHLALDGLRVGSTPGSATVRTSKNVFNYDGTAEDFDAQWAELEAKAKEERAMLRKKEEGDEDEAD